LIGTSIAHYRITEKIGAGGMGEVWRAKDGKLGRDVALKIIPDIFAQDAQRMARFQREAQLLASLNHANIAAIYGTEESQGRRALVLELVEGEDLSQRLRSGHIPVDEALEIAVQIAEALEAAHEKGVVHRDLKPANVKITPEGKVKVLDFGLAKALEGDSEGGYSDPSQSLSPTLTAAATRAGVVLGTAAYMSPEQARGKSVDRRTDIWAFGVVLFEMLVRRQLFAGETISDTLAAVIKDTPDWSLLPAETPQPVADLLGRCLQKDQRRRLQSIGEARIALEDVIRPAAATTTMSMAVSGPAPSLAGAGIQSPSESHPSGVAIGARRGAIGKAGWLMAMVVVAAVAAVTGRMSAPIPHEVGTRKFHIDPEGLHVEYPSQPALSPDGRHIAFFAGSKLWVRDLGSLAASEIPGTGGATSPFWSPDGAWLAFGQGNRIYKVPATGGTPTAIGDIPFLELDGGTWGDDDMLILAPNSGPMVTVSSRGGDTRPLFPVSPGESDYHTPSALPGGRGVLFTTHRDEGRDSIEVFSRGERRLILRIEGARLEYATWSAIGGSGTRGHLIYHRMTTNSGIWAVPFDIESFEATGEPFILDPDGTFPSVARDGSLLFAIGAGGGLLELVTVSRAGVVTGTIGQPQTGISWPEVSPDGKTILVSAQEADNRDIWLHDIARGTRTRMTFGSETDWSASWLPGGREIAFTNGSAASNRTYRRPADGTGEPELFFTGYHPTAREGVALMAYDSFGQETGADLHYRPIDGSGEPGIFLATPADELGPQLSPDGKFIVFMSNESGSNEVYLTSFPGGEGKWQVSDNGGAWPRWSRAGDEIIYRQGAGAGASLMSVRVQTTPTMRLGSPMRLFTAQDLPGIVFGLGFRGIDVTPDPDTFVMLRNADAEQVQRTRLVFSESWYEAYRTEQK
jgi:Tol biopolymer transport system component